MTQTAPIPFDFMRVSAQCPCSVCGKPDWCLISRFGDVAICCRVESKDPAPAFSGWRHPVLPRERIPPALLQQRTREVRLHPVQDFGSEFGGFVSAFGDAERERAAGALGLSPAVFRNFVIGYDRAKDALALPAMQTAEPVVVGIRFRSLFPSNGLKWWSRSGSTAGLLLPIGAPIDGQPVVLTEGPSDALAASQLGLHAVGRWSCSLDHRQLNTLQEYLAQLENPVVLVVGDNDASGRGNKGADGSAAEIAARMPHVTVRRVQPPDRVKDMRDWVRAGATADAVIASALEVRHA